MPTPIKESLVFTQGSLVYAVKDICSVPRPSSDPRFEQGMYTNVMIRRGSIGVILKRPNSISPRQFFVEFVGGERYWVYGNEIEFYFGEDILA